MARAAVTYAMARRPRVALESCMLMSLLDNLEFSGEVL